MNREYKIALSQEYYSDIVYLSQYDSDYDLVFSVLDKYSKATQINGYTAKFQGTRTDGLGFLFEGTASDDRVAFRINTSLTAISGTHKGEIVFYDASGLFYGSANVQIVVEPAARPDGTIDADVKKVQTLAEQVQEIVDTAAEQTTAEAERIVSDLEADVSKLKSGLNKSVTDLKSAMNETDAFLHKQTEIIYSRNRLDNSAIVEGLLQSDGSVVATTNRVTSDFIPVADGTPYRLCYWDAEQNKTVSSNLRYSLYYDANKNIIGAGPTVSGARKFSANNLSFVRLSFDALHASTTMLLLTDTSTAGITAFIPYSEIENIKYGKTYKVVANGDSITFGHKPSADGYDGMTNGVSYMTMACEELGFELDNYSISMSTLAYDVSGNDTHQSLIGRYQNMSDEADLVYIAIGSNDWYYATGTQGLQLGTFDDRVNNTFYGALHLLCAGLKQKYGAIPIVFATPIKRWIIREEGATIPGNLNARSKAISEWAKAIKEVCDYYGIPVVDMYAESFINPWLDYDRTNYAPDGTHPNLQGHERMMITCLATLRKYLPILT